MSDDASNENNEAPWQTHLASLTPVSSNKVVHQKHAKLQVREPSYEAAEPTHLPYVAYVDNPISGDEVLSYAIDHLPRGTLSKIKRGNLVPDYTLDLHQTLPSQCLETVVRAIALCQSRHWRWLCIIHGKNLKGDFATIKSMLNHALPTNPHILAFHSAPARLGGTGALLCLIKQTQGSEL